MANKRTTGKRAAQRQPRPGSRGDAVMREMSQLTEAERVKRWLRGMRAADELTQRLRAAEGSGRTETADPIGVRPVALRVGRKRAGR